MSSSTAGARVLTGVGGVGKTQLAVEYAHSHTDDFDVVWWVRAEEPTTLRADLASLAQPLGLRAATRNLDVAVREVRAWLRDHDRWMVVADNAEDADSVAGLLPEGDAGQVLVTSRSPHWAGTDQVVAVDVFTDDEAVEYLLRRTGETGREPARSLAQALGCLPLALEQAVAYANQTPGLGLAGYLELFRERAVVPPRGSRHRSYPTSVAVTCALAVERVEQDLPAAATLLRACAFLAPETVPLPVFSDADELPEPLPRSSLAQRDALAALSSLSLVRSTWPGGVAVDRVVQAVVRDSLPGLGPATPLTGPLGPATPLTGPLGPWAAGVVRLVERAFPADPDNVADWGRCHRLVPHALAATAHDEGADLEPQATSRLLARVGIYLQARGQADAALRLLDRSLAITEVTYGPDCAEAAVHLANLAMVHQDAGDLASARICLERALVIARASHGPDHPAVGTLAGNLAGVLAGMGELTQARLHLEDALAVDRSAYGPDHPVVAGDLSSLALVLWSDGDLTGARRYLQEALAIDEAAAVDDTAVARDHANLALVLADLGQLDDACRGLERALAIVESACGPDHPEVGSHLNNLAMVLQDCGRLVEARTCLERALAIARNALGPEDTTVAGVLNNLGAVLGQLGDLVTAAECFERALAIDEPVLGSDHPEVDSIRENRAQLLRILGTGSS